MTIFIWLKARPYLKTRSTKVVKRCLNSKRSILSFCQKKYFGSYASDYSSLSPGISEPNYIPKKKSSQPHRKKFDYPRKFENVLFTPWKHGQQREGVDLGACNIMNYISHELHISHLASKGIDDIPEVNFDNPAVFTDLISSGYNLHISNRDNDKQPISNDKHQLMEYEHLNVVRKGQEIKTRNIVMMPQKPKLNLQLVDEYEEGSADKYKEQYRDEISIFYENIFNQHQNIPINENVLTVGGDHSISIGSLISSIVRFNKLCNIDSNTNKLIPKSERKYKMACIWIDAHCDINTWKYSASKNLHGMPVSFAVGIEKSFSWVNDLMGTNENNYEDGVGRLYFDDLYYWGIRDVDMFEQKIIEDNNVTVIQDENPQNELNELKSIIKEYDLIHCSLDIDGLDPSWTPSTGTPVNNGLHLYNVLEFLDYLMLSHKCMAMDLVEYNPLIGDIKDKMITRDSIQQMLRILV